MACLPLQIRSFVEMMHLTALFHGRMLGEEKPLCRHRFLHSPARTINNAKINYFAIATQNWGFIVLLNESKKIGQ